MRSVQLLYHIRVNFKHEIITEHYGRSPIWVRSHGSVNIIRYTIPVG